jgi:death-on-curing protein
MANDSILFLSVEEVKSLEADLIARYGGLAGVRDEGLLIAAVMMPQQAFGGALLHEDVPAMAGAYLFHLAKNHPFLDGNKRIALGAALAFLHANGWRAMPDQHTMADITLAVAAGQLSKDDLIAWLRARLPASPG